MNSVLLKRGRRGADKKRHAANPYLVSADDGPVYGMEALIGTTADLLKLLQALE